MKKIKIKINNKIIACSPDKTIMQAAKENGIDIPGLCGHGDFLPKTTCRICAVEVKGRKNLVMSCREKVSPGLEIRTDTERVKESRNLNIELIFAEHIEKCPDCVWNVNCALLNLAEKYKIEIKRFPDRKQDRKIYKFSNAVEIDGSQCIDCRNCIDACSLLQNINYLELKGKSVNQEVVPVKDKKIDCIYCGQCAVHCPVGSAQEQAQWEMVEKILDKKSSFTGSSSKKVIVAQFAPSIRVSIGEEFKLAYGKIMTGQVAAGLKKLGFDYVFDVNFGADITTIVEAEELVGRLTSPPAPLLNKERGDRAERGRGEVERGDRAERGRGEVLPMITSCCPGWVKYVEFYHPELIPNLTTARSPHIHIAGAVKTYWAKTMNINPGDITVVSIMPCTAKKYEAARPELKVNGSNPVDYVLTTREFAYLLKKNNINFPSLKSIKSDNPLGEYSGAGAIYGGSGGVMESALRTAHAMICGKKTKGACLPKVEFKQARGLDGIKEAVVNVGGKKLRIAVVNGIGNVEPVIKNLSKYDYIEVMACPGGCIGGGGQPIPTNQEIRQKRIEALYKIDKKQKVRKAHENKSVLEVLAWLKEQKGGLEHRVLHTSYKRKRRGG